MAEPPTASPPRTVVGMWLLATAVGEPSSRRQRLVKQLNGGQPGINPDEPAVVSAACALALKRLFPSGGTDQQITDLVAMIRTRITAPQPAQYEVEAVIKAALTGAVPVGVTPGRRFAIEGLLFTIACIQLNLAPLEIRAIVGQGERAAAAAGFSPPLSNDPSA